MGTFTYILKRYPVNFSSSITATNFVYGSDFAAELSVTKSLAAGAYGVYIFKYQPVPVNAGAPQGNVGPIQWRLTWTSGPTGTMEVFDDQTGTWGPDPNYPSGVNPTIGWVFLAQFGLRSIISKAYSLAGLQYVLNNYPTTYEPRETISINGGAPTVNTGAKFDIRLLAAVNVAQTNPLFNPLELNQTSTISGNWACLPAANSPFPSTLYTNWQPTSSNITTTLPLRLGYLAGLSLSSVSSYSTTVTAPDANGFVGSFLLSWNGIISSVYNFGLFIGLITGTTGSGNTVPGGASADNVPWPTIAPMQCVKCNFRDIFAKLGLSFDLTTSPVGLDTAFNMAYTSLFSGRSATSFGFGWRSTQNIRVSWDGSGNLSYQDESGNFARWNFTSPNTYTPVTKDNFIEVNHDTVNHLYILTFLDRTKRYFDDTTGRISKTVDRNGNTLNYRYDGSGRMDQVSDNSPTPRVMSISYTGSPDGLQPKTVTTGSHTVTFSYQTTAPYRLSTITDPAGLTTTFNYDVNGRLSTIVDPTGKTSNYYNYDSLGRLTAEQSYGDSYTTYEYGYDGLAGTSANATTVTVEDLTGVSPLKLSVIVYDSAPTTYQNNNVITVKEVVDFASSPITVNTTQYTYGDPNNPYSPTQILAPNLTTTDMTYTSYGQLKTLKDTQNNLTTYTYAEETGDTNPDHRALLVKLQRPNVTVNGVLTTYPPEEWTYDTKGNLKTYKDSATPPNTTTFNRNVTSPNTTGTVSSIVDANGHTTSFEYYDTTSYNLKLIRLPLQPGDPTDSSGKSLRTTEFAYDAYDNIISVTKNIEKIGTNPVVTATTGFDYDANRRLTTVTDPLLKTWTRTYGTTGSNKGLPIQSESPSNNGSSGNRRKTNYYYDSSNRLSFFEQQISVTPTYLTRAAYSYSGYDEVIGLQRQQKSTTPILNSSYAYDTLGRMVASTDPLGRMTRSRYAPYCSSNQVETPRGIQMVLTRDSLCRLTQVATQSEMRQFTYDQLGRLTSDTTGSRYGWYMDPSNNPNSFVGGRYDIGSYATGRTYNYDPRDLLLSAVYPEGTEQYVYDNVGNLTQQTDVNGVVTTYTYYDNNQLATVTTGGNTFTYTYDLSGRPKTITFPASTFPTTGITLSFTKSDGTIGWDKADQLLSMRYLKGTTLVQSFAYTYDDSGNRITMTEQIGTTTTINWSYVYDWLDRLVTATRNATATNYTYDGNNNRTVTGTTTAFDAGDQLTSLTSGATTTTFTYDRDGNLVTQTSGANTTTYKWNDFNNLYDIVVNGTSTMKAYYDADNIRRSRADGSKYFSSGSLPLSETRLTGPVSFIQGAGLLGLKQGGNFYYMLTDGLGSVRGVFDSGGTIVATNETDAYGVNLSSTGSAELRANTFTGALGVRDDANGLYYARNRYYSPSLGRWLSRDPIGYNGGDLSLYSYTGGHPVGTADPSGLHPGLLAVAEAAAFGAGSSILVGAGIRYLQGRDPFNRNDILIDGGLGAVLSGGFSAARNLWAGRAAVQAATAAEIGAADATVRSLAAKAGQTLGKNQTPGTITGTACGQGFNFLSASGKTKVIPGLIQGTGSNLLKVARTGRNTGLYDAERKGLELLASTLSRFSVGGVRALASGRFPCTTCLTAARNFTRMFPGMSVTIAGGTAEGIVETTVYNSVLINTGAGALGPLGLALAGY